MHDMRHTSLAQVNLHYKIKQQEAKLIACTTMQNSMDLTEMEGKNDPQPTISDTCSNVLKVLNVLLSDQGTVQKKWSKILNDKEKIEIGSTEHKLELKKCIEYLKKIDTI